MIDLKEFQRLKNKVTELQRDADKAEGALAEQMKRLKDEYGCESLERAEGLLAELTEEQEAAEKQYAKASTKFEKRWGEELDL